MPADAKSAHDDRQTDGRRSRTRFTVEGIHPTDVTADLLCDVMDAAKAHGLAIEAVSVDRNEK